MTGEIKALGFGILSPEEIRQMATIRIVTSDLYDADGYPVDGGVMDSRMGVIDPGMRCRTCGGNIDTCKGHFGYLELAKPVVHVLFAKTVYNLLKVTCQKCGRIMTKERASLEELAKSPPSKCPFCSTVHKKVSFVKPYSYNIDKKDFDAEKIRELFEKIPDRDLKRIEFVGGRPEWLILTLLPVSPVNSRPSITLETGERSEDDLTHKLVDIVRINQSLKENIDIGAPEFIISDLWELVQYHVSTLFDNELSGIPQARHRSGRPLRGMVQRLKGKEGRIRGNLLGKRVNFSARTVISPDPMLSVNEVGVPEDVASELTIPEHVTPLNIEKMKKLIVEGKASYLIRPDGRRIRVTDDNRGDLILMLDKGWIVERKLQDNDVVLFNRQPSLHKVSIMAHYAKIMPHKTFRMNPSVCPPYNADFDGDEMNLHALQTQEARSEASLLMDVKDNIISPKFGGPLVGLDLDQITGISLLTKSGVELSKEETSDLLAAAGIDAKIPDKKKFSGRDIVSLLLPKELNLDFKANLWSSRNEDKNNGLVEIENGQIKSGVIDKTAVGAFKGKIINSISALGDNEKLRQFIDNAGRIGVAYLMKRGLTIGISDLDLSDDIMKEIRKSVKYAENKANKLIAAYNEGTLKILPGMTRKESLEAQMLNTLANGLNDVSKIVIKNVRYSDIIAMTESGAKGSNINTTQMAACVGSETILGKRIQRGYMGRTLPHFKRGDLSAASHGFVSRGFKEGLLPYEFFWNLMNGREGLMDKSLRTRKSGYMQRRLINSLQDLKVLDDLSIRGAMGEIVQFFAGEDGIDPSKSEWGKFVWENYV
ncbi:MAG: DNA-directed RNA polymerase subunit A' [Candidatus Micrarchaeota archaeon]|nr:DNA-directed RNA polymerase subunit A' [Candidatus Micrarchaeota archaeon]